ncbi:MAG: metallophosphoesterase [Euryarchaeota archaeon]|nr:metallophosphoesterase [Euryarchaeota archaeon]
MKIAVVSDTHDNQEAVNALINELKRRDINTVFHMGDIISPFTLRNFYGFEYLGVFGNNDGEKALLGEIAREMGFALELQPALIEFRGKKFLLYHGSGSVEKTRKIVESFAKSGEYDFVLYGHTHIRDYRRIGKTVLLNPGEVCGYLFVKRSFAILDVDTSNAEFVEF